MAKKFSTEERNKQLEAKDGLQGVHGRIRIRASAGPQFNSKEPIEFECLNCDAGRNGKWAMLFHNVYYGTGCPVCESVWPLLERVHKRFPDLDVLPYVVQIGQPTPINTTYEVRPRTGRLTDKSGWKPPRLKHSSLRRALATGEPPGANGLKLYRHLEGIFDQFLSTFPKGVLHYIGSTLPGTTSPGPYYLVKTDQRLLRESLENVAVSERQLLKQIKQEHKDVELRRTLEHEAKESGATILEFVHSPSTGLRIHYISRTTFGRIDTPQRARETLWGQTRLRKGEALALLTIAELFPSDDWAQNTRPEFLRRANGHALELDGYSEKLKLALEYHGPHHYGPVGNKPEDVQNYQAQVERDKEKRLLCKDKLTLIEVHHTKLDPKAFFSAILKIVRKAGLQPTNPTASWRATDERWRAACLNPFANFQRKVLAALGNHQLVSPELEFVLPDKKLKYRCGNCGKTNQVIAGGLPEGSPRTYCPKCKGPETGAKRRQIKIEQWRQTGLPESFLNNLTHNNGSYWHTCQNGDKTQIHGINQVRRHIRDGEFRCPTCVERKTGLSSNHAAQLEAHQESLRDSVQRLGLSVCRFLPYKDKEAVVEVQCPQGHIFEADRSAVALMARNKCLTNRTIVPSACPTCCFPCVTTDDAALLRSTVFHRLYVLRGLYPTAEYISDFDPLGRGVERYNCGGRHKDGTAHPPIRISFRGLSKAARLTPKRHLCHVCGLKAGEVIDRGKNIDDLLGLMKAMREEIDARSPLAIGLKEPTVELVSGVLSARGEINTTQTRLRFGCGVPGHETKVATKDYYFNRAPGRGAGFCSACVALTGEAKAPLPRTQQNCGELRTLQLRTSAHPMNS